MTTATARTSSVWIAATRTTPTTTRSPDYVRRAAKSRSDFATAKNIGLQYLRRRQNADDGGPPV